MDETFCIPVKVENENDLYEKFLPSGLSFSSDLTAYLEDCLEDRELGENVSLELQSSQELDMEHFRDAFHVFMEKLIVRNNKEIHLADLKAILFLLMGIVFVAIGVAVANRVDMIVASIISAIGSYAMWGAAATFIETLPTLRVKKKRLEIFANGEIRYKAI
jgi:hypothetical protein